MNSNNQDDILEDTGLAVPEVKETKTAFDVAKEIFHGGLTLLKYGVWLLMIITFSTDMKISEVKNLVTERTVTIVNTLKLKTIEGMMGLKNLYFSIYNYDTGIPIEYLNYITYSIYACTIFAILITLVVFLHKCQQRKEARREKLRDTYHTILSDYASLLAVFAKNKVAYTYDFLKQIRTDSIFQKYPNWSSFLEYPPNKTRYEKFCENPLKQFLTGDDSMIFLMLAAPYLTFERESAYTARRKGGRKSARNKRFDLRKPDLSDMQYFDDLSKAEELGFITMDFYTSVLGDYGFGKVDEPHLDYSDWAAAYDYEYLQSWVDNYERQSREEFEYQRQDKEDERAYLQQQIEDLFLAEGSLVKIFAPPSFTRHDFSQLFEHPSKTELLEQNGENPVYYHKPNRFVVIRKQEHAEDCLKSAENCSCPINHTEKCKKKGKLRHCSCIRAHLEKCAHKNYSCKCPYIVSHKYMRLFKIVNPIRYDKLIKRGFKIVPPREGIDYVVSSELEKARQDKLQAYKELELINKKYRELKERVLAMEKQAKITAVAQKLEQDKINKTLNKMLRQKKHQALIAEQKSKSEVLKNLRKEAEMQNLIQTIVSEEPSETVAEETSEMVTEGFNQKTKIHPSTYKGSKGIIFYLGSADHEGFKFAVYNGAVFGYGWRLLESKVGADGIFCPNHVSLDILKVYGGPGLISMVWTNGSGKQVFAPLESYKILRQGSNFGDLAEISFKRKMSFPVTKIEISTPEELESKHNVQVTLQRWDSKCDELFSLSSDIPKIRILGGYHHFSTHLNTTPGVCGSIVSSDLGDGDRNYGYHVLSKGKNCGVLHLIFTKKLFDNLKPYSPVNYPNDLGHGFKSEGMANVDPKFYLRYTPSQQTIKFDHWEYIGTSKKCVRPFRNKPLPENPRCEKYREEFPRIFEYASRHMRVQRTLENYEKSVKKGDAKLVKPVNAEFSLAKDFALQGLAYMMGSTVGYKSKVNKKASGGRAPGIDGYQTKGDVLDDPDYVQARMAERFDCVFSVEDKDEILSKFDVLDRSKLRTYFSSCAIYIFWQKFFFAEQNSRMKKIHEDHWIQYGFVKQRGGFARLASKLEDYNLKFCGDESGWDRKFPLLREVYEIRKSFLDYSGFEEPLDYTINQILKHTVVLKNGDMYKKEIGNPSGSNNTTEDNCIGHYIIAMYLCIKIHMLYKNVVPTFQEVHEFALIFIYGDDNLGGFNTEYFGVSANEFEVEFRRLYHETYNEFGMDVKFLKTELGFGPLKSVHEGGEMEFLGSRPLKTSYGLIPKPNIQHLSTSLLTLMTKDTEESFCSKLKAAIDLTYCAKDVDQECLDVFRFVEHVCKDMIKTNQIHQTSNEIFFLSVALQRYHPIELITGRQSGGTYSNVNPLFFFFRGPKGGRRNKISKSINYIVKMSNNKNRGQEIALLQRKLHQEKMKNKAATSRANSDNSLHKQCVDLEKSMVMAIINPESVAGFRYPDLYTEGTACYQAINNFFIPTKLSTTAKINHYPDGSYYCEVHPEMEDSVRYIEEVNAATGSFPVSGTLGGDYNLTSNIYGLYTSDGNRAGSTFTDQFGLTAYDVVIPVADSNGVVQPCAYNGSGQGEPGYYYMPNTTPQAGVPLMAPFWRITLVFGDSMNPPNSTVWTLKQVDEIGTVMASVTGVNTSPGESSLGLFLKTSDRSIYSYKLVLELNNVSGAGAGIVPVTMASTSLFYYADHVKYSAEPLPDLQQLKTEVEKYRVTAQSALVTYFGSNLTNGGFATAILYRGGIPSQMNSLFDYSQISEHPNSYDGPLRDGTYGYWEGMDSTDYSYRSVLSNQEYKRPYLIMTGTYTGDPSTGSIDQANILRGRVITQFEFTSKSQIFDVKPSPSCILGLQEAMRVISGVPNVMENGKHLTKLRRIASKAGKTLTSLGRFAWTHRAELKQIASAVTPMATAFL